MRLLIVESKLVNIVSKFIGELYELSMPGGNDTYFLDKNETVVFVYDNYYEELTVNTEVIHNVSSQLGIPYKDCLLYTSPSPRDRQKSRMPSSA